MNSKSKKILALLTVAVLALAGVAVAAASKGTITTSGPAVQTDLVGKAFLESSLPSGAVNPVLSADAKLGFNVPINTKIEGNLTLPTRVNILNGAALTDYRGIGAGTYAGTDMNTVFGFNYVPMTKSQDVGSNNTAAFVDSGAMVGGTAGDAEGGNARRGIGVAGAINVAEGVTFVIQPGMEGAVRKFISNNAAPNLAIAGSGGMLRLKGKDAITEVYAPNNNAPTSTTAWNDYGEGTFLWEGRLNVKHSNALGFGNIALASDTTIGFDNNEDISFGGTPFQGANSLTDRQFLSLQRINRAEYENDTKRRAAPVTFDVGMAATMNTVFTAHSGVQEIVNFVSPSMASTVNHQTGNERHSELAAAPTAFDASQLYKTGPGKMVIASPGAKHTGGTVVEEGILELLNDGLTGNRYVGELGLTWQPAPDESKSPLVNHRNVAAAAHNNALTIKEAGHVYVNRDQFWGNFDGDGRLTVKDWARNHVLETPQITVTLDRMSTNANDSWQQVSKFSGVIDGQMNFVLRGGPAKALGYQINADNTKLILDGLDNQIDKGDTTIVDGTLSINSIAQIPPGDIRLGLPATNPAAANAGIGDVARGIWATDAVPTLHGWGNFTVPQKVTTAIDASTTNGNAQQDRFALVGTTFPALGDPFAEERVRKYIPNLAADRGYTVKFNNVDLTRVNPDVLDNGVGYQEAIHFTVNNQFGSSSVPYAGLLAAGTYRDGVSLANPVHTERTWAGTVAFVDEYTFPADATAANPFMVGVMNGVWHVEKTPIAGYSRVFVSPGATFSFGSEARDFLGTATAGNTDRNPGMDLMLAMNSRIRVKVSANDFKSDQKQATVDQAILKMSHIDYTFAGSTKSTVTGTVDVGFQMGPDYKDQELVLELDLSDVPNQTIPKGTWINILTSHSAHQMQALNYTPEAGERRAKVKFASTGTQDFNLENAIAYVDVDSNSILLYTEETVKPTDPTDPTEPTETTQQFIDKMSDEEKAKLVDGINFITSGGLVIDKLSWNSATQSITAYLLDVADDGTVTVLDTFNGKEIELGLYAKDGTTPLATGKATVTDGKVTVTFTDLDDLADGTYVLKGTTEDGAEVTIELKVEGGVIDPVVPGGSSGCDAGFGAFALLALGAAVVLRKKD